MRVCHHFHDDCQPGHQVPDIRSCATCPAYTGRQVAVPVLPKPEPLKWAYGVTCVKQRLDDGLLEKTLKSLSVAGFDGIPEGAWSWPGLTTMAQPMREMGRDACRRLFLEIAAGQERTNVEYAMTLVVRESTDVPRTERR